MKLKNLGRFRIPYIGIEYTSTFLSNGGNFVTGALIGGLDENGTAVGSLEVGDVIIRFGDKTLSEESLVNLIQRSEIGDTVEVEIVRSGERQTVEIEVGERK